MRKVQYISSCIMNSYLDQLARDCYAEISQIVTYSFCEGVWLPDDYLEVKDAIDNFEIRDDDTWVSGFFKTGTTWTEEMVWCTGNDLDFERATEKLDLRFPLLEGSHALRSRCLSRRFNNPIFGRTIEEIAALPSPRFICTHLPYHLLPKALQQPNRKAKIVHVIRNPKDTCISAYHFFRRIDGFRGSFEDFLPCTPFWEHLVGFYKYKGSDNILILKYEDMKKNLPAIIQKVAAFLGKSFSDDQVSILAEHLSFNKMKENKAVSYEKTGNLDLDKLWGKEISTSSSTSSHMRKGEVDQWKSEMSQEIIESFNDWTDKKRKLYPELESDFGSY
ncbi:luciferin sulfotransferase-like [Phymastichus coffea]|uniref:luciferin sulfotransferase-like n=1 Tax=Phymastichus coffea TaxID=108790 RepID=UPI00273CEB3B|nr:luciferin sulfotransferase-like [Phymastichus coffea]